MNNKFNYEEYFKNVFTTYNSLDLLIKISSLNLVFENQNKSVFITYLTKYALFNQNINKPKCSSKTFKDIVNKVQEISSLSKLDQAESSFFEYVFLDKRYGVFNGMNTSSAYYVNMIIQMLIYKKTSLPEDFKIKALKFIKAGLTLSDIIFKKTKISFDDIEKHQYIKKIIVPANLDELKSFVCIDKNEISDFITDEELRKYFTLNMENQNFEDANSLLFPFYYDSPFIINDDEIIVIDPTAICYFIKRVCLSLSDKYHCLDEFIKEYNNFVSSYSFDLCKSISGISFLSDEILDNDTDIYKCKAFKCGDGKAVLSICVCSTDSCVCSTEFTDDTFGIDGLPLAYDELIDKTINELERAGFSKENLYTLIILSSITGSFNFCTEVQFVNDPIIVPSSDLEIIQINESKNPLFLQCFSELLNYIHTTDSLLIVSNMLDLISFFSEKNYDLYLDDNVRVKGTYLKIKPDFIYPYSVKALRKQRNNVSMFEGIEKPIRLIKYEENIYFNDHIICPFTIINPMFLQLENSGIWAFSNIGDENGVLISRVILYWLNQINKTISKYVDNDLYIYIINSDNLCLTIILI